jgi:hypothetical protein
VLAARDQRFTIVSISRAAGSLVRRCPPKNRLRKIRRLFCASASSIPEIDSIRPRYSPSAKYAGARSRGRNPKSRAMNFSAFQIFNFSVFSGNVSALRIPA